MLRIVVILGLAFTLSIASGNGLDSVGALYQQGMSGSLGFVCTVSVVEGEPLGFKGPVLLTASHCVSDGIRTDMARPGVFTVTADYFVTFDERQFFGVNIALYGDISRGYDVAILTTDTPLPSAFKFGDWNIVKVGDTIRNYAYPMGLGKMSFNGYIALLDIARPLAVGWSINWRNNMVTVMTSAGGSSGSLILNNVNEVIAIHVGVAGELKVSVPIWKVWQAFDRNHFLKPSN